MSMQLGIFILGILSGWGMEWLVVRFFIPNPCRKADAALQACRKENGLLRSQLNATKAALEPAPEPVPDVTVAEPAEIVPEAAIAEPAAVVKPAEADVSAEVPTSDDFSKLAGIGPKLAETMQAANIRTYAQLAAMDMDGLNSRLSGVRFSKASAETWPAQAGFAERDDWEGLKAYQASLKA